MRKALAIAAVLALAATASATSFDWPSTGSFGRPRRAQSRHAFLFAAGAATATSTITPSAGPTFPCLRTSTGTYQTSASALATAASNTCRVDYRGLEIEEGRTNLVLQSQALGTTPWGKTVSAGNSLGITTDGTLGPDGSAASLLTYAGTVSGTGTFNFDRQTTTVTAGSVWTLSAWTHLGTLNPFPYSYLAGDASFSTPTFAGWTKFTKTVTSAASTLDIDLGANGNSGQAMGAGTLYVTDSQSELGPFATSYIPTTTTAVARGPDQIDVGAITLSATPSLSATVNLEGLPASGTATALAATDGTTALTLAVTTTGAVKCSYGATSDTTTGTVAAGTATKIACMYDGTTLSACIAGTCHGTAATLSITAAQTHLRIGWDGTGNYLNGFASTLCASKRSGGCS